MKPTNIISAYQSILAIDDANVDKSKFLKMLPLSKHEAETLSRFCNSLMQQCEYTFDILDGYYLGYSIKQISKEFDLLRFSDDLVINIELKSELKLSTSEKMQKIINQMTQNHYYLTPISENVDIYTYIENDGLYKYDSINKNAFKVEFPELLTNLSAQSVNYDIDPDSLFIPSNYLISPFNNTKKFMNGSYFLTGAQQNIKQEILSSIDKGEFKFFCISANAGTGKTLLTYDISKTIQDQKKNIVMIHCGKLNTGHDTLICDFNWRIFSIRSIHHDSIDYCIPEATNVIFIDESHRIRINQLNIIIKRAKALKIIIVFSYDSKQYLKDGEARDTYEYLKDNHPEIMIVKKTLTNKIRTNKEMASFIKNLFNIGSNNSNLNYEKVSIVYFNHFETAKDYLESLCKNKGWKAITYTDSTYETESISQIASICGSKAHNVIGQEFDKVVFVMDNNFKYDENDKLKFRKTYYSLSGMLYQIVTRVVNRLEIIVLDNPKLYGKLLEIKALDKQNNS